MLSGTFDAGFCGAFLIILSTTFVDFKSFLSGGFGVGSGVIGLCRRGLAGLREFSDFSTK